MALDCAGDNCSVILIVVLIIVIGLVDSSQVPTLVCRVNYNGNRTISSLLGAGVNRSLKYNKAWRNESILVTYISHKLNGINPRGDDS